jgi:ribosomal protein S27E
MAKPSAKGPQTRVDIFCSQCGSQLYRYRKGGKGALVKCFIERIVMDYTETPCTCPGCGAVFARETLIRGVPAYKMIGGKVRMK